MLYECATVLGLPKSRAVAHCERAVSEILALILPEIPKQRIDVKHWRLVAGNSIDGPLEEALDKDHHVIRRQRAFYAERQGIFENVLPDDIWGILRRRKLRRFLRLKITRSLRSKAVLVDDRRTRRRMAEDHKERYGITDKDIYEAAGVRPEDFYRWRKNGCSNRSVIHRRLVWVLFSPAWPPTRPPM
jgi:hypothetical protein